MIVFEDTRRGVVSFSLLNMEYETAPEQMEGLVVGTVCASGLGAGLEDGGVHMKPRLVSAVWLDRNFL
jgi:hypothetical protein